MSRKLAKVLKEHVPVRKGSAEYLPWSDNRFDLVLAFSVMEHVINVKQVVRNVHRLLSDNGVFFFHTASSLCPAQNEIRYFPCFSWYPDRLKKLKINWAVKYQRSWIGDTSTPATNWSSPWKTRRLLREAGFAHVYDRWDLIAKVQRQRSKTGLAGIIARAYILKICADILIPSCEYAAMKSALPYRQNG